MKRLLLSLLLGFFLGSASGEDRVSGVVTPQARRRLDPTTSTAVVMPAPTPALEVGDGMTVLDKYVVSAPGLVYLLKRPKAAADPKGKFTLTEGGRFRGATVGPFRIEVGLWTHVEIMADDDAFTNPGANRRFDFLRIKW